MNLITDSMVEKPKALTWLTPCVAMCSGHDSIFLEVPLEILESHLAYAM
jgi:hypothetical protein